MRAVGVKTLKSRLSEYLRLVKNGEVVLVTERDTVIAELRPPRTQMPPPSSLEEGLDRMGAGVTRAAVGLENWKTESAPARARLFERAVAVLDELRGE